MNKIIEYMFRVFIAGAFMICTIAAIVTFCAIICGVVALPLIAVLKWEMSPVVGYALELIILFGLIGMYIKGGPNE